MTNIKTSDLASEALESVKQEKLVKACTILKELLEIKLQNEEIFDILKEKDIENDMGGFE